MTITLDVSGEVAQRLASEANRLGLSVNQFVLRAALGQLEGAAPNGPSHDPHLAAAGERAQAAARRLEALGIVDELGNRRRSDVPEDMREGADRDFGG